MLGLSRLPRSALSSLPNTALETVLLKVLTNHLSTFIANLTKERLRIGLWAGDIVLTNLELRLDALDALQLPVRLVRGMIGRLRICVPWSRLRSEPVEVQLEDVQLLARLRQETDPGAHGRRERLHKRMRLDAEELLRGLRENSLGSGSTGSGSRLADSLLRRLGASVLDNLKLSVSRLHLRLESTPAPVPTAPAASVAAGLTLERFEMRSIDADSPSRLHKLLSLVGASLYLHSSLEGGTNEIEPAQSSEPARSSSEPNHSSSEPNHSSTPSEPASMPPVPPSAVVMAPMNAQAHLWVQRAAEGAGGPSSVFTSSLEESVELRLSVQQYRDIAQLCRRLEQRTLRERYERFRPAAGGGPAARWRFAAQCLLADLTAQRRWHPWGAVRRHAQRRREYQRLWQSHLCGVSLGESVSGRLLALEEVLRLDDILLFRALARRQLQQQEAVTPPRGRGLPYSSPYSPSSAGMARSASATQIPRSASASQLFAMAERPFGGASSVSQEALTESGGDYSGGRRPFGAGSVSQGELAENGGGYSGGAASPDTPKKRAAGGAPRTTWLGWLWHGPYSATGDTEKEVEEKKRPGGDEEPCVGYTPLEVSGDQLRELQSWTREWVDAVPPTPKPHHARAHEPVQLQVELKVRQLRLQLHHDQLPHEGAFAGEASVGGAARLSGAPGSSGAVATELMLSGLEVQAEQTLAGLTHSRFWLQHGRLSELGSSGGGAESELGSEGVGAEACIGGAEACMAHIGTCIEEAPLARLLDAVRPPGVQPPRPQPPLVQPPGGAVFLEHEAWPAMPGGLLEEGDLRRVEAGSELEVRLAPLELRLGPAWSRLATLLASVAEPIVSQTMASQASAPPSNAAASVRLAGVSVQLPMDKAELELTLGSAELFSGGFEHEGTSHSPRSPREWSPHSPLERSRSTEEQRLRLEDVSACVTSGGGARLTLLPSCSLSASLRSSLEDKCKRHHLHVLLPSLELALPEGALALLADSAALLNTEAPSSPPSSSPPEPPRGEGAPPTQGAPSWSASAEVGELFAHADLVNPQGAAARLEVRGAGVRFSGERTAESDRASLLFGKCDGVLRLRDAAGSGDAVSGDGAGFVAKAGSVGEGVSVGEAGSVGCTWKAEAQQLRLIGVSAPGAASTHTCFEIGSLLVAVQPASWRARQPRAPQPQSAAAGVALLYLEALPSRAASSERDAFVPSEAASVALMLSLKQDRLLEDSSLSLGQWRLLCNGPAVDTLSACAVLASFGSAFVDDTPPVGAAVAEARRPTASSALASRTNASALAMQLASAQVFIALPDAGAGGARSPASPSKTGASLVLAASSASFTLLQDRAGGVEVDASVTVALELRSRAGGPMAVLVSPVCIDGDLRSPGVGRRELRMELGRIDGHLSHEQLLLLSEAAQLAMRASRRLPGHKQAVPDSSKQADSHKQAHSHKQAVCDSSKPSDSSKQAVRESSDQPAPVAEPAGLDGPPLACDVFLSGVKLSLGASSAPKGAVLLRAEQLWLRLRVREASQSCSLSAHHVGLYEPQGCLLLGVGGEWAPPSTAEPAEPGPQRACGLECEVSVVGDLVALSASVPLLQVHLCTRSLGGALQALSPLQLLLPTDMPQAQGPPNLTVDAHLSRVEVLLHDSVEGFRLVAHLDLRFCKWAAGEQLRLVLPSLLWEWLTARCSSPILGPCTLALSARSHAAEASARLQSSEAQVHLSLSQLRTLAELLGGVAKEASALRVDPAPARARPGAELCRDDASALEQPTSPPASSESPTPSSLELKPSSAQEASRIEDADGRALSKGASRCYCLQLGLGTLSLTLRDFEAPGSPLLQFVLDLSRRASLSVRSSGWVASAALRAAVYSYRDRGSRHGWEPLLEQCHIELDVDSESRNISVGSVGGIELNISPRACTRMLGLLGHLDHLKDQDRSPNGRRESIAPFAPFHLHNRTGGSLSFQVDAQERRELPSGAAASLASSDAVFGSNCVHVFFEGFQAIELRSPYRDRYRLWPTEEGTSMPIIYVFLESRNEGASVVLTLRTSILLHNATDEPIALRLLNKAKSTRAYMRLPARAREALPVAFQGGSLKVEVQNEVVSFAARDGKPRTHLELIAASLQSQFGRGASQGHCASPGGSCCQITVERLETPKNGCVVCFHPPLVLHNALLCELEYELSNVSNQAAKRKSTVRGALATGKSLPLFWICKPGCYLRARCRGFTWSQPVMIPLGQEQPPERRSELKLRCPIKGLGPGEAFAVAVGGGAETALCLRLCLSHSPSGMFAELSGWLWVQNDTHLPLQCQLVSSGSEPLGAMPTRVPIGKAAPLLGARSHELPELMLCCGDSAAPGDSALGNSALEAGAPSSRRVAYVSLPELLQLDDEEIHLEEPAAALGGVESSASAPSSANAPSAANAPPQRTLHMGVKLLPLSHRLGSSLLLSISPRFVLLNRTSRAFRFRQDGCASSFELPPATTSERAWVPLHWTNARKPRQLALCRLERGAEWSGAVRLASSGRGALSISTEVTLRLRNLESGGVEFVRLSMQKLKERATRIVAISEERAEAAPIQVQNLTAHELKFKQMGVSVICTVAPNEQCPYSWDDPTGKARLFVSLPAHGVHFRCDVSHLPSQQEQASRLLQGTRVQLRLVPEGPNTRVLVEDMESSQPRPRASRLPAILGLLALPRLTSSAAQEPSLRLSDWALQLQLPKLGVTVLDDTPRELLHLSLRGVRLTVRQQSSPAEGASLALAVASVQLDYMFPCREPKEEVLLRAGAAVWGDAISLQLAFSMEAARARVHARAMFQEIDVRLDEEALGVLTAALQPSVDLSKPPSHPSLEAAAPLVLPLRASLEEGLRLLERQQERSRRCVFVECLRLQPVKLTLSLHLAPNKRTEAASEAALSNDALFAFLQRGFRWLGSTLINAEQMPLRLPEVFLERVALPQAELLEDVRQRYNRALLQQAYKLLPSSTLLGDPYGMLRRLRKRWLRHQQQLRRSSWRRYPLVLARSFGSLLVQALLTNTLKAGGLSLSSLSKGFAALLAEGEGKLVANMGLVEGLIRGVGGIARETARGATHTASLLPLGKSPPLYVEGAVLACAVPIGLFRAARRLFLYTLVGSIGTVNSTLEALGVAALGSGEASRAQGRTRAPRLQQPLLSSYSPVPAALALALQHGLAQLQGGSVPEESFLHCCKTSSADDSAGDAYLVLVSSTLLHVRARGEQLSVLLRCDLVDVLLVQRQRQTLRVLCLAPSSAEVLRHDFVTADCDAAASTFELLRVASANARVAAAGAAAAKVALTGWTPKGTLIG